MIGILKTCGKLIVALSLVGMIGAGGVFFVFWKYSSGLPDHHQLIDYKPAVMTRVHAGDGRLIGEYARERRIFVPVDAMPKRLLQAFLSAEDKTFYGHFGIDPLGVASAMATNIKNKLAGGSQRPRGASTITQQVAKNFFLSAEVSYERKIREAILALRLENTYTKDRILELYLNEIFLGLRAYGVAAAALNYFDKSLDELTLAEIAYLAALPKAPNNYHPERRTEAALERRDWVLGRMVEDRVITTVEADAARALPLGVKRPERRTLTAGAYFTEEVRREIVERYGESTLYEGGLTIRTTLDSDLQTLGKTVLRRGLRRYDRRHGWRGPLAKLDKLDGWAKRLAALELPRGIDEWRRAVVLKVRAKRADIGFADGGKGVIPLSRLKWARPWIKGQVLGPRVVRARDVLAVGDVVAVRAIPKDDKDFVKNGWALEQIPEISGGIVAMDPHTGRVLAMVGGFEFRDSQFNRASQALRQPGSAFKPFVYAAALDHGFTPSSIILDGPFVVDQGPGKPKWKPVNYSGKFYGPSTVRLGLEKSRNLMTVRLAQEMGMDVVIDYAKRFGIVDDMPPYLPMSLGAGETTLLRLTAAYAMLVNGGKQVDPSLIDRIQDRRGRTVFRHDARECAGCRAATWAEQPEPQVADERERVLDPATAYQVVSMLRGVVLRGTGRRIASLKKPLAGKTGTTNESRDTWFMGFAPDLAVGVFVGFDEPTPLGRKETGSSVAAPVFKDFMAKALETRATTPFRIPSGIKLVRVEAASGRLARPGDKRVILEAFKPGTEPKPGRRVSGTGAAPAARGGATPRSGTGGLY